MVAQLYRYLGRITDAQLRDALGASGASKEDADRFAGSLRERIEQVRRAGEFGGPFAGSQGGPPVGRCCRDL